MGNLPGERVASHLKLTFYLCLLTAVVVGLFLKDAPAAGTLLPLVYQWSVVGYYGTLVLLAALLLLPLSLSRRTGWLWPLLGWAWLLYLAMDFAVFNLYRFHLDWLMVDMFVSDFRGMGIPVFVLALSLAVALVLLGAVWWSYASRRSGARRHWPWFAVGLLLMPLALVINSIIHIWAAHFSRDEITRYRSFLPIYYPVEYEKKAAQVSRWLPQVFPAAYGKVDPAESKSGGVVRYPLAMPQCVPDKASPSILMIVLESWQAAAMNPQVTPNIARFANQATRFTQHVSSGAATVPGLFGLMYGLHPNYFPLLRSTSVNHPSVFTQTLDAQGYRTRVFTSSNLDGFSLRRLFFPQIADADYVDHLPDAKLVQRYIRTLDTAADERRFDFLFLTSSHSPYNYPPDYAHFKPLPVVEGGYALDRNADNAAYKNDYFNSLRYLDALVGKALAEAEHKGRLRNTWVIITGDHAEEFNENGLGYWGHGSNFSRWQTQTPLIVRAPGHAAGAVEQTMSLHQDVVPTLMTEVLGCSSPVADYSHGANLFALPERRGTLLASYMADAYLIDGVVLERSVRRRYDWHDMRKSVPAALSADAAQALRKDEGRFLSR